MNTNQNEAEQLLCRNNCGFYGHQNFDNYCSKCYNILFRDSNMHNDDIVYSNSKFDENNSTSNPVNIRPRKSYGYPDHFKLSLSLPSKNIVDEHAQNCSPTSFQENFLTKKKLRQVCAAPGCKKRLLLTSVECKCGKTFCSGHRYAEQHECPFDYKSSKEEILNKANPIVAPSKLNEI